MRPDNLQIQKRGNNGIPVPEILRKRVGYDFTHLNKSSWKFLVVSKNNTPIITKYVIFVIFQWTVLVQTEETH